MQRNIRRLPPRDHVQWTRVSNKSTDARVLLTSLSARSILHKENAVYLLWSEGQGSDPDANLTATHRRHQQQRSTSTAANEHQCTAGYFNGFRITISVLMGCG